MSWTSIRDYLTAQLPGWLHTGWSILLAVAVFFVGRALIRAVGRRIDRIEPKSPLDPGVRRFLRSLVRVALYLLLIYLVAAIVGIPTASLVALIGSAGLAVGLALQGSLANFAGGVLILVTHPFRVGDYIVSGGGAEGTVESIDLFCTRLCAGDEQRIVIPNGALANSTVRNVFPNGERRVDLQIGVSYSTELSRARELILGVFAAHPALIRREEAVVFVDRADESAVVLEFRCWVRRADYLAEKWSLLEDVKRAFDEGGVEIPFNQLDVRIRHEEKN